MNKIITLIIHSLYDFCDRLMLIPDIAKLEQIEFQQDSLSIALSIRFAVSSSAIT